MRLKVAPGDFQVREVFEFEASPDGPYFVHLLKKQKLDTQTALAVVAREAGVSRDQIAFAGLKDRQAETEQWISIRGKRLDFDGRDLQVKFMARAAQPVTSKQFGKALGRALSRPAFMPIPGFALRLRFGEVAHILTTGQRVLPERALGLGYPFKFPTIDAALADILK